MIQNCWSRTFYPIFNLTSDFWFSTINFWLLALPTYNLWLNFWLNLLSFILDFWFLIYSYTILRLKTQLLTWSLTFYLNLPIWNGKLDFRLLTSSCWLLTNSHANFWPDTLLLTQLLTYGHWFLTSDFKSMTYGRWYMTLNTTFDFQPMISNTQLTFL